MSIGVFSLAKTLIGDGIVVLYYSPRNTSYSDIYIKDIPNYSSDIFKQDAHYLVAFHRVLLSKRRTFASSFDLLE
jgi:hypothetical protein